LRALAIFTGGGTLEACEAIIGGDLLASLRSLAEQQLIQRRDDASGEPRYSMLQTIHSFALEKLRELEEEPRLALRHAIHFAGFADRLEDEMTASAQVAWMARFDDELPNLRAAFALLMRSGDAPRALRMASALSAPWNIRGSASEGIGWIEQALAAAPAGFEQERAHGHAALSSMYFLRGEYDRAIVHCEGAIDVASSIGDDKDWAVGLTNLGCVANHRGDEARALDLWQKALVIERRSNNLDGIAILQNNAGIINLANGDLALAKEQFAEAYRIRQQLGDATGQAAVIANMSQLALMEGDISGGRVLIERCLQLYRDLKDQSGIAWMLYVHGLFLQDHGTPREAVAAYLEALPIAMAIDDRHTVHSCVDSLASTCLLAEEFDLAARVYGYADTLRQTLGIGIRSHEQEAYDAQLARLRAALGDDGFASAWRAGELLTVSEVIERAGRVFAHAVEITPLPMPREEVSIPALSARELEVLRLVAAGRTDREISDELFIARKTASDHVSAILRKLDVPNRSAAGAFAHRHRLI
jgi:DNA-binding CsgD family transcriptional regulator